MKKTKVSAQKSTVTGRLDFKKFAAQTPIDRDNQANFLAHSLGKFQDIKAVSDDLVLPFLEVIKRGRLDLFDIYMDKGFPINTQCARSGFTPLHMAATCCAREIIYRLMERDDVNYLLRDNQGRLASELAFIYGDDPDLSELIGLKEVEQGDALGVKVTRRPT